MRLIYFIGILTLATVAYCADADIKDKLYNDVIAGDYDEAVRTTKDLAKNHKQEIIEETIDKLLTAGANNTMTYIYKLWHKGGYRIIKYHFPIEFKLILSHKPVQITFKQFGAKLKLKNSHSHEDIVAYGDGTNATDAVWKFIPFLDDNKPYFKIVNSHRHHYLKLGDDAEPTGDHRAYGTHKSRGNKHHWYLRPVKYQGEVLLYIFNRHFNQALKQSYEVDSNLDRVVFGHNGEVLGQPETFGWLITHTH